MTECLCELESVTDPWCCAAGECMREIYETEEQMKLCIHCKWHSPLGGKNPICMHSSSTIIDLVDGKESYLSCTTQRNSFGKERCGSDGKFWIGKQENA